MQDPKDVREFPIEKIYLVSGGLERGLDVTGVSAEAASDSTMDKVFLVPAGNSPELVMDVSKPAKVIGQK